MYILGGRQIEVEKGKSKTQGRVQWCTENIAHRYNVMQLETDFSDIIIKNAKTKT
jgi:hypothetical protein